MPVSHDTMLRMQRAGETVVLLGDRALYWPARERLIIADLHLGKGDVFRRHGIAVPAGTTQEDLDRLTQLLAITAARELWIVGDVLHGPASQAGWRDAWMHWRQSHAWLEVAAFTGNHDRALEGANLGLRQLGEWQADGPFMFRHEPQVDMQGRHVIAGHVHPKGRLAGVPRSWPAFWLTPAMTVLPAFSALTGGHLVAAGPEDGLALCVEGAVIPIPTGKRATGGPDRAEGSGGSA